MVKILALGGDGIGPEIISQAVKVLDFFGLGEFSAIWPNDRISSIKIRDGYVLTLYEHGNFQGKDHGNVDKNKMVHTITCAN